jgi:hypothetical protein
MGPNGRGIYALVFICLGVWLVWRAIRRMFGNKRH